MNIRIFIRLIYILALLFAGAPLHAESLGSNATTTATGIVRHIEILGLSRTDKHVVMRELLFNEGDRISLLEFEQSIQRLRNTRIFSRVEWRIEPLDNDGVNIVLLLEERWTLIPVAKFNEGGDTMYYVVGVYNVNSFGRYLETGAQYEAWNNEPGGVIWFRNPRFMDRRVLLGADLWSVKRPRTLYEADGSDQGHYVSQRQRFNSFVDWELNSKLTLGVAAEWLHDRIIAIKENDLLDPQIKSHLDSFQPTKNLITSIHGRWGKIDQHDELLQGSELEFSAGYSGESLYSDDSFYKAEIDAKMFHRLKHDDNFAVRVKLGTTDSSKLPFYFFLGGFENVRGYLDGQIRARQYWQSNVEYRHTFIKRNWYYGQALAFADAMQALHPDSALEQNNTDIFSSLGLGLRIGSPKIYRFNLRLDLALVTSHPATSRLSVGVQQFF